MAVLQRYAQLTAGSAAEAVMDTAGVGEDGYAFTVLAADTVEIYGVTIISEHTAGFGRVRIRRDATAPPVAAPPLAVADNIEGVIPVPLGSGGYVALGRPVVLDGSLSADAAGTGFYVTIEQAGGAGFAGIVLHGRTLSSTPT